MGRHAIIVAGKSKIGGKDLVSIAVPDPPQLGRVKAAPETDNQRPTRTAGIVARKAIEKRVLKEAR